MMLSNVSGPVKKYRENVSVDGLSAVFIIHSSGRNTKQPMTTRET